MAEQSRALPFGYYGDPAKLIEVAELDHLGCLACASGLELFDKVGCADPRNPRQKKVPWIGHRCRWFKERAE